MRKPRLSTRNNPEIRAARKAARLSTQHATHPEKKLKHYKTSIYAALSAKQMRFCEAFVTCGTVEEAARKSGYKTVPYGLLSRHAIQSYLTRLQKKVIGKTMLTAEKKLHKLELIIDDAVPEEGGIDPNKAKIAISAIETANNMQGDNAPVQAVNVNLDARLDRVRTIALEKLGDNIQEY